MSRVLIDRDIFWMICDRYAHIPADELTEDDRTVILYLGDKLHREDLRQEFADRRQREK